MTIEQLKTKVEEELNSRELKCKARFCALDNVVSFIKDQYGSDAASLPTSKEDLKDTYKKCKGKDLSGAENSAINELCNQLS